jgi:hypothetical protein
MADAGSNPDTAGVEPAGPPAQTPNDIEEKQSSRGPLVAKVEVSQRETVAVFLALDVSIMNDLPQLVVQKIAARANEFEALKSEHLLSEVGHGTSKKNKPIRFLNLL